MIWILTIIAIIGTVFNAKGLKVGFIFWICSNAGFAVHNMLITEYAQAVLFTVYFGLAIYGYRNWAQQE